MRTDLSPDIQRYKDSTEDKDAPDILVFPLQGLVTCRPDNLMCRFYTFAMFHSDRIAQLRNVTVVISDVCHPTFWV